MTYYYEINKQFLEGLESTYGLPTSMVTRNWDTVTTSLDGLTVVIEAYEPLDETILGVTAMTRTEAQALVKTTKYYIDEEI